MYIFTNYINTDTHKQITNQLMSEFCSQNSNVFDPSNIENIINEISKKIFSNYKNFVKQTDNFYQITLSPNIFPIPMQKWISEHADIYIDGVEENSSTQIVESSPYTYANTNWNDVEVVTIAKEGQRGAWFFSNTNRGSVVIKGQEDLDKQMMGSIFLLMMGINTPQARLVDRNSVEGKQIASLGEPYGLNRRHSANYLVMNRVLGPSYTTLSSEDIEMVQNNLMSIGELSIYDLVLGNYDRFQLDTASFNSGNIMFENGVMHAIDTDCVFDKERDGFTKLALKKIIQNRSDLSSKLSQKLAKNLGIGVDSSNFPAEVIDQGMKKAIRKLLEFNENLENNKETFINKSQERGITNVNFPKYIENYLQIIYNATKSKMGVK